MNLNSVQSALRSLLRGAGQVVFQNNAWSGLLILIGVAVGATPIVAAGAAVGLIVSTLSGWAFRSDEGGKDAEDGLHGFNGMLIGCALPTFFADGPEMWFLLILGAALSPGLRYCLNHIMSPFGINSLTFPFVMTTWIILLASYWIGGLHPISPVEDVAVNMSPDSIDLSWRTLLDGWLKGISEIFLIDSTVAGAIILVALAVSCWRAALWATIGAVLVMPVALLLGAPCHDMTLGLFGFSPALTAIALATVFRSSSRLTTALTVVAIVVTLFIQLAMAACFTLWNLPVLTAPFCVGTWLFLLAKRPSNTDS